MGGHWPLPSSAVGASGVGNLALASVIATEPLGNDMYPLVSPGRGPVIVTRLAPNALMAAIVTDGSFNLVPLDKVPWGVPGQQNLRLNVPRLSHKRT